MKIVSRMFHRFAFVCLLIAAPGLAANTDRDSIDLEVITLAGGSTKPIPEFNLIDHSGIQFGKNRLQGRWSLMFFGYTHCPDICPTTMADISRTFSAIKEKEVRESIDVYFISVDPDRDSPEHLSQYIGYFNPAFTAATSTHEELTALTDALGVSYKINKEDASQTSYLVSHSGYAVLINPSAEYAGLYFPVPDQIDAVARDLSRLVTLRE